MADRLHRTRITYEGETAQLVRSIGSMERSVNRSLGKIQSQIEKGPSAAKRWKDSIIALNQAFGLLSRVMRTTGRVFDALVGSSMRQATQMRQLSFAVSEAGLNVRSATVELEAFFEAQTNVTRYGDDASREIARQFAVMAQASIDSTDDIISATRVIQGVMEASGASAETVTRGVARILEGEVNALSRYGVRLEGTVGEAMDELTRKFGVFAEQIDSTEQQVAELNNRFGDMLQRLGDAIRVGLVESGVLEQMVSWVEELTEWISKNEQQIATWVEQGLTKIKDLAIAIVDLGKALEALVAPFQAIGDAASFLWDVTIGFIPAVVEATTDMGGWNEVLQATGTSVDEVAEVILNLNPVVAAHNLRVQESTEYWFEYLAGIERLIAEAPAAAAAIDNINMKLLAGIMGVDRPQEDFIKDYLKQIEETTDDGGDAAQVDFDLSVITEGIRSAFEERLEIWNEFAKSTREARAGEQQFELENLLAHKEMLNEIEQQALDRRSEILLEHKRRVEENADAEEQAAQAQRNTLLGLGRVAMEAGNGFIKAQRPLMMWKGATQIAEALAAWPDPVGIAQHSLAAAKFFAQAGAGGGAVAKASAGGAEQASDTLMLGRNQTAPAAQHRSVIVNTGPVFARDDARQVMRQIRREAEALGEF